MKGKVVIVGTGPGDPELVTIKGLKSLKEADVVIYDKLIPEQLLKETKLGAELISAGKEPGRHARTQREINELMIKKAGEGKLVVRLKGGDPMIFGRGGEEILALASSGIEFEVVPSVSSATVAPTVANIPITLRGLSSSFVVVTGREDPTKLERFVDFRKVAGAADTIIILMGLERLEVICNELMKGGLPPSTPAAIIREATTAQQVTIEGTLDNIAERSRKAKLEPPAVLVVGRVVRVRKVLQALRRGVGLVLTFRPDETTGELEALLEKAGHTCLNMPAARVVPAIRIEDLEGTLKDGIDYAVFTSQVTAGILEKELPGDTWGHFSAALKEAKVVAVGPRTKEALEKKGIRVDIIPERYCLSSLAGLLGLRDLRGARVVLFRSVVADKSVEEELEKVGAKVRTVITHKLVPSGALKDAVEIVKRGAVRALVFTSSLIAKFVDEELKRVDTSLREVSRIVHVFSIGPLTSKALIELGVEKFVEAKEHTAHGLFDTIVAVLGRA